MAKQEVKSNLKKPLQVKNKDGNITQIVKINIDSENDIPKRRAKRRKQKKLTIDPTTLPVTMPFNDQFVKEPTRSTMFRQNIPTFSDKNPNTMNINLPAHNTNITNTMPNMPDYSGILTNLADLYTQALTPQLHTNLPKPVTPPATPMATPSRAPPAPPLLSSPAAGAPPPPPLPPTPPLARRPMGNPETVAEGTLVAWFNNNYQLGTLVGYTEARRVLEIAKRRFPGKNWAHYEGKIRGVGH